MDAATAAHVADRDRDGAAAFATTVAFATGGNADAMPALFRAIEGRSELVSMFFGVYAGRVTFEELIAAVG